MVAIAATVLFYLESPRQTQAFLEISLSTEIESPLFNFSSVMKFTQLSEQNETHLIMLTLVQVDLVVWRINHIYVKEFLNILLKIYTVDSKCR